MKPGAWGTKEGKPAIVWFRPGVAARGEPSTVQEVRTYTNDAARFDAYKCAGSETLKTAESECTA